MSSLGTTLKKNLRKSRANSVQNNDFARRRHHRRRSQNLYVNGLAVATNTTMTLTRAGHRAVKCLVWPQSIHRTIAYFSGQISSIRIFDHTFSG